MKSIRDGAPLAIGIALGVAMLVWFCVALSNDSAARVRSATEWANNPRNPINICIAKGGVPITSAWDGRLKDCQVKDWNH